jgi:hypothetical protein
MWSLGPTFPWNTQAISLEWVLGQHHDLSFFPWLPQMQQKLRMQIFVYCLLKKFGRLLCTYLYPPLGDHEEQIMSLLFMMWVTVCQFVSDIDLIMTAPNSCHVSFVFCWNWQNGCPSKFLLWGFVCNFIDISCPWNSLVTK